MCWSAEGGIVMPAIRWNQEAGSRRHKQTKSVKELAARQKGEQREAAPNERPGERRI